MHVTLRQLRVFDAVVRHLSYTRAATEMHLSQPAVSMLVSQLEEAVGLPLFDKLGRQLYLTEAGQEVHRLSRNLAAQFRETEGVLLSLKGLGGGRLDIAVASTINYFAPRLLGVFHRRYPGITLKLEVTNREHLVQLLDHNQVDLVLMGQPPEDHNLASEPFMSNPLVVIAPPGHPLESCHHIPPERLAQETFVMRETGSGTRQAMERFFADRGIPLKTSMEMTRNEALKQAVRAGMGLTVVSLHTIELELETGRLVTLDVDGFPIQRTWYVVYSCAKRLTPAAQAFRDFVLNEAGTV